MANIKVLKNLTEITTENIKEDRKKFNKDILQCWRDGHLSKEYIKAYPNKVRDMLREGTIDIDDVKTAKNVWTEDNYYKEE